MYVGKIPTKEEEGDNERNGMRTIRYDSKLPRLSRRGISKERKERKKHETCISERWESRSR